MKKIGRNLIIIIIMGIILTCIFYIKYDFLTGLLFFIAYESLIYPVFKGYQENYNANKIRKIIHIDCNDDVELMECKINKKLNELCDNKFAIIDVKIVTYIKNDEAIKEAYILYY